MSNALEKSEFLLYSSDNGDIKVDVFLRDENIWLTQKKKSKLFDTSSNNVGLHLKNIYTDGELIEKSTTEDFSVVQNEGGSSVKRTIKFYNLDAIITVGYRINSKRDTQFHIWETKILKEFEEFNKTQIIESDFDKMTKELLKGNKKYKS